MKIANNIINLLEGKKEVKELGEILQDVFEGDLDDMNLGIEVSKFDTQQDSKDNDFEAPIEAEGGMTEKDMIKLLVQLAKEEDLNISEDEIKKNIVKIVGSLKGKKARNVAKNDSNFTLELKARKVNKKGKDIIFDFEVTDFEFN